MAHNRREQEEVQSPNKMRTGARSGQERDLRQDLEAKREREMRMSCSRRLGRVSYPQRNILTTRGRCKSMGRGKPSEARGDRGTMCAGQDMMRERPDSGTAICSMCLERERGLPDKCGWQKAKVLEGKVLMGSLVRRGRMWRQFFSVLAIVVLLRWTPTTGAAVTNDRLGLELSGTGAGPDGWRAETWYGPTTQQWFL